MSIIFGIRKPIGAAVTEQELENLAHPTELYAPDGVAVQTAGRVGMGFQPYHTHLRSKLESGPTGDPYGNLVVVDGRLDNYRDLCQELRLNEASTADSGIILAAYLRWGTECFSHFIGDWALSLWSTKEQVLYLARDHAGARTLYFENQKGTLLWSTYLDTFFADSRSKQLDESYAACYLAAQPLRDLTPYKGIRAVLPSHYIVTRDSTLSKAAHWEWISKQTIRYNSDQEYEEHFLALFEIAVERRDGSGSPTLAQLSGGMDSSAIVCMSDHIRRSHNPCADLLDTISFYDDSEPGWNEKPYFSLVEAKRGKSGIHIETSFKGRTFEQHDPSQGSYLLPGVDSATIEREQMILSAIGKGEYRSILSGMGGDEVLGGVPTAIPELADYFVEGRLPSLSKQTVKWCLTDRSPFFYLLVDVARSVVDLYQRPHIDKKSIPPWMQRWLRQACTRLTREDVTSGNRLGLTPSHISNGFAWWSIMETLPHVYPGALSRPEYRYPFLDKQLVDYLFAVPREQILRPGYRRSLMRRSLRSIVPREILERRRKGYQIRGPLAALQQAYSKIDLILADALIGANGLIDPVQARFFLDLTNKGTEPKWWRALMRAINLELWLRGVGSSLTTNRIGSHSHRFLLANGGAK